MSRPRAPLRDGPTARRLLAFLLSLAVVWGILQLLVWPLLQPAYSAAVTAAAGVALSAIESGQRVTTLRSSAGFIHVRSDLSESPEPAATFDADVMHFYLVAFASLFLTFPSLELRRRLILLGVALAALFLFHVAVVLIKVEHMYAVTLARVSARNYTDAERWLFQWVHDNAVYRAIPFIPALALVALFMRNALNMRNRASGSLAGWRPGGSQPDAEAPPISDPNAQRRRRLVVAGGGALAAVVALVAIGIWHAPKVRARQAEKEAMLGFQALQSGNQDQAETLFQSALERNPEFTQARDGLGAVHMMEGNPEQAAEQRRAVVEQKPEDPVAHLQMGNAFFGMSDYKEAVEEYQKALKLDPERRETWFNLAMALKKLGNREQAELALTNVLRINPDDADATFEMAVSMIASRRACLALPHLRRHAELAPFSPRAQLVTSTIVDLETTCLTPPTP